VAKVFKDGWVAGGLGYEIVECLVATGDNARGCDVVTENAAVHHLSEERPLRDEFGQKVWNVLLAFEREGFLIARTAAEGDDDAARLRLNASGEGRRDECGDGRCRNRARRQAQKFAASLTTQ
jgi:hypothetical protein